METIVLFTFDPTQGSSLSFPAHGKWKRISIAGGQTTVVTVGKLEHLFQDNRKNDLEEGRPGIFPDLVEGGLGTEKRQGTLTLDHHAPQLLLGPQPQIV